MQNTRKLAISFSETKYFTGKACPKGHVEARRTKTGECLGCKKEALVQWRAKNPEKVKLHNEQQHKNHAEKLAEKGRIYYHSNKDSLRPGIIARARKRQANKINRTPKWLTKIDFERMQNEYKLASILTKLTGTQWHVDHIIPLQGKLVSGLHVPYNIQVISAAENASKSNKYEVI